MDAGLSGLTRVYRVLTKIQIVQYVAVIHVHECGAQGRNAPTQQLESYPNGVYTFRISGSAVHRIGPAAEVLTDLHFGSGNAGSQANEIFEGSFDSLLMVQIQDELDQVNPHCQVYKPIREREYGQDVTQLKIVLTQLQGLDRRQFDLPTTMEIAVLMPGNAPDSAPRDIVVDSRQEGLHAAYTTKMIRASAYRRTMMHSNLASDRQQLLHLRPSQQTLQS
ncbi:hypothetical protein EDD11_001679 [Mortierella claussenii]|nr:hypothetical protein EDD11_001679 [Mortierella claussenii]